ncbi:DNA polymerase III subunit delta [Myroides sp. LJL119]
MDQIKEIVKNIKSKNIAPIYLLMGEEPYYIDKLSDYIQEHVLSEEEKGFNQVILYGRDVTVEDIISNAKRFPLMADRQVIIVKEAQDLGRNFDLLEVYANNPQPSTALVLCYKYKTVDKKKKVYKAIAKNGVVLESKKLKDYQIEPWLTAQISAKGYRIDPKALAMLVEYLGTDLLKISNEINKLFLVLEKGSLIDGDTVEQNIGISKDYNNFELLKAIVDQDTIKAFKIAKYFAQNPKNNPIVVTIALVYGYFSKLLLYHGLKDKSATNAVKQLKISPYGVKDYEKGVRIYAMKRVSGIISSLKDIDLKSKGVNALSISQDDLLKEMLVKIFSK